MLTVRFRKYCLIIILTAACLCYIIDFSQNTFLRNNSVKDLPCDCQKSPAAAAESNSHAPVQEKRAPVSEDYSPDFSFTSMMEARMEERRAIVEAACKEQRDAMKKPEKPNNKNLYIEPLKYKWAFCPIYKAAHTYWVDGLTRLMGGQYVVDTPTKSLRKVVPLRDAYEYWHNVTSFIVVRNPLERLISAYRNKFENAIQPLFYNWYGKKMIDLFRRSVDNSRVNKTMTSLRGPTFPEFIQYVLKFPDKPDDHWNPYVRICSPCLLQYDFIVKFETFSQDQTYVVKKLKIDNVMPPLKQSSYKTISDVSRLYYSQLQKSDVIDLFKYYYLDFSIFNYDYSFYYDVAWG